MCMSEFLVGLPHVNVIGSTRIVPISSSQRARESASSSERERRRWNVKEDLSESLFKFVVVSPVELALRSDISKTFTRFRGQTTPDFHQRVLDTEVENRTAAVLRTLAEQYLGSTDTKGVKLGTGGADVVEEIGQLVRTEIDGPSLLEQLERALGAPVADIVSDESFAQQQQQLWSLLYATSLAVDSVQASEVDALVRGVQVVHFLETVDTDRSVMDSFERRLEIIDVTPLLPADFRPSAESSTSTSTSTSTSPELIQVAEVPAVTAAVAPVQVEIASLTAAIDELERVESTKLAAVETVGATDQADEAGAARPNLAHTGDLRSEPWRNAAIAPWRMLQSDLDTLTSATQLHLDSMPTTDGAIVLPEAIEALEAERSRKLLELHGRPQPDLER